MMEGVFRCRAKGCLRSRQRRFRSRSSSKSVCLVISRTSVAFRFHIHGTVKTMLYMDIHCLARLKLPVYRERYATVMEKLTRNAHRMRETLQVPLGGLDNEE
jgi:hypothetical protein